MSVKFPDSFVDEVRRALKASEVVGRYRKLQRAGSAAEFVDAADKSFTVNDTKGIIHDFGKTGFNGDIFKFIMQQTGCTFPEAVERLARDAGLTLPKQEGGDRAPRRAPASDEPPPFDDGDPGPQNYGDYAPGAPAARGGTAWPIVKVYPYKDADGAVLYEVTRHERHVDGKKQKTFRQRRPLPGKPGVYLHGLDEGEYIRPQWSQDFFPATDERRKKWAGKIAESIHVDEKVALGLYMFPELRDETIQDPEDRRTIWCPEGEKNVETLVAWGLVATCVSGGAKNLAPHHVEYFRGCDVIIQADNDKAGRAAAHKKAAALRGVAARVRVLDWRDHRPGCREKYDVTDWRDEDRGDKNKLMAIVDKLVDWTPVPPESHFGAIRFEDLDAKGQELEWLIQDVMTRSEVSIWWGPPGCGKSFLILDAAYAIARGGTWYSRRVKQGLVIYQAGEGGRGVIKRMKAFRQYHSIDAKEALPLVLLPMRVDLFNSGDDTKKLIEEINNWRSYFASPLELVIIDTMSAASTGFNENASEDVSKVLQRCHQIAVDTGAHVMLVHHTAKMGTTPRGWSGLTGNVETSIEVRRLEERKHTDERGVIRDRREFIVRKQKDGEDGQTWGFVLRQVTLGRNNFGDAVTSCVVTEIVDSGAKPADQIPPGYAAPKTRQAVALIKALDEAVRRFGATPNAANIPAYAVSRAVTIAQWRAVYREAIYSGEDNPTAEKGAAVKLDNTVRKTIQRLYTDYGWNDPAGINIIGKAGEWVWRTPRKVHGVDPPPVYNAVPPPAKSALMSEEDEQETL